MKIIEEIDEAAMLEQLAEECTELQRQHSKWQGSYEKRIRHL